MLVLSNLRTKTGRSAGKRSQWLPAMLGTITALAALSGPAQAAPTEEERAVLAPLLTLLDGLKLHDKNMMQSVLTPEGGASLLRDGKLVQLKLSVFSDRIPFGADKYEEPIYDPLVKIDDNIAMIWAPYDFFLNDKLHHCGTDIVTLVRQDGRWLITGIADNSRTNCTPR